MFRERGVLISGAGIAGLSTAYFCFKYSIPYTIIEKLSESVAEGAGIALPANAVDLLDYMSLGDLVREKAYKVRAITYASPVELLSTASLEEDPLDKNSFLALPRAELHKILLSCMSEKIRFSTRIHSVRQKGDYVAVVLNEDGKFIEEEFDLIVGADGVHSDLRKMIFPDLKTNDFGLTVWRWISDWNVGENGTEPFYMFDTDRVFMVYPISSTQVYCYAHVINSSGIQYTSAESIEVIKKLFSHCSHNIIYELLQKLNPTSKIIVGKMESVEDPAFVYIDLLTCFIGDACNACTPMLQQGAALAFEGAVVLVELLKNFSNKVDVLKYYEEFRSLRVKAIVKSSNDPMRFFSKPGGVDMNPIYENIRQDGPLNVQGWRKLLSSTSVLENLCDFIDSKKKKSKKRLN